MSNVSLMNSGNSWIMSVDDVEVCRCRGMSMRQATDAFAANWPAHAEKLDAYYAAFEDLAGPPEATPAREARSRAVSKPRGRLGSGARFRELYGLGKTNAEALVIVRGEFSDGKATLSDAAWNRARFRKEREQEAPAWDGLL